MVVKCCPRYSQIMFKLCLRPGCRWSKYVSALGVDRQNWPNICQTYVSNGCGPGKCVQLMCRICLNYVSARGGDGDRNSTLCEIEPTSSSIDQPYTPRRRNTHGSARRAQETARTRKSKSERRVENVIPSCAHHRPNTEAIHTKQIQVATR